MALLKEGIRKLFEDEGLSHELTEISVGPAFGFYRIAVEFMAVAASSLSDKLYKPSKAMAAVCLYPIKLLDPLLLRSSQADRIAGGYLVIMKKV